MDICLVLFQSEDASACRDIAREASTGNRRRIASCLQCKDVGV